MKRFLKITGIVVAALFVIGIFGAIVTPEGDTTASSDEGSTASEAVGEESEPTVESEPVAESEPNTEPEPESEPAQEEPEPEPEPAPESELKQGNETAFVTTIETFRTSEDYPWMDEDSLTYAEGDELLVLMGYEVCERIEALDQPITMESFEADADAYAEEQGIWGPEAVSLYLAAEHLCPNAHEALPES